MRVIDTDQGKGISEQLEPVLDVGVFNRCSPELSKHAESMFADTLHKSGLSIELLGPSAIFDSTPGEDTEITPDGLVQQDGLILPDKGVSLGLPMRTSKLDSRQDPFKGHAGKLASFLGYLLAVHVAKQVTKLMAEHGQFRAKRTPAEAYIEIPLKHKGAQVNGMDLCEEHPVVSVKVDLIPELKLESAQGISLTA